jgi:hypothetical protein
LEHVTAAKDSKRYKLLTISLRVRDIEIKPFN